MVADGTLRAPLAIGRDHLDCGSVASPYRETEAMKDGSDAIADWPLLNAMVNVASGASWVSLHHGGGVGMGRSIHAGQVTVADGTALASTRRSDACSPTTPVWASSGMSTRATSAPTRWPPSAASASRCARAKAGARDRLVPRDVGGAAAPRPRLLLRGLPPLRLDRRRHRLPCVVPGPGRGPRSRLRTRPQRQPVGLARRHRLPGRGPRRRRRHRLAPGLRTGRRRLRRPAGCRLLVRRAGRTPPEGSGIRQAAGDRQLRRRGRRPLRPGLRRLPARRPAR